METTAESIKANFELSDLQFSTLRDFICKDASLVELSFFLFFCKNKSLDPFSRQIYLVKYAGKPTVQMGIDGLRAIASRTGLYQGQTPIEFYNMRTRTWSDVWVLQPQTPHAARIGILRKGFTEPLYTTIYWEEYAKTDKTAFLWKEKPLVMFSKCVESVGLRRAFPEEMNGIYSEDEFNNSSDTQIRELTTSKAITNIEIQPATISEEDCHWKDGSPLHSNNISTKEEVEHISSLCDTKELTEYYVSRNKLDKRFADALRKRKEEIESFKEASKLVNAPAEKTGSEPISEATVIEEQTQNIEINGYQK